MGAGSRPTKTNAMKPDWHREEYPSIDMAELQAGQDRSECRKNELLEWSYHELLLLTTEGKLKDAVIEAVQIYTQNIGNRDAWKQLKRALGELNRAQVGLDPVAGKQE